MSGTFVNDTTPVSELTATPATVPDTTDNVTASLLASVTANVYNEEYDWPAVSARVVSALIITTG